MSVNQLTGANAYAQALKNIESGPAVNDGGTGEAGKSAFASLLEESVTNLADSTGKMEETAAKALTGQADVVEVVAAVSNAEMVVETVVAVRDRVMKAYEDIIKMPV